MDFTQPSRASDISQKKKAKFRGIFRVQFMETSANLAGFSQEKVKIRGKIGLQDAYHELVCVFKILCIRNAGPIGIEPVTKSLH